MDDRGVWHDMSDTSLPTEFVMKVKIGDTVMVKDEEFAIKKCEGIEFILVSTRSQEGQTLKLQRLAQELGERIPKNPMP